MTVLPCLMALLVFAMQTNAPLAPAAAVGPVLAGTVLNGRTLDPIPDAQVSIVELGRGIRTSSDGRFSFDAVPAGTYTLAVSTIGFIFVRRTIVVAAVPLELTIPLAEGAGTYRESVSVSASPQADEQTTGRNLNESQLQDLRGVVADDPMRALQALPGVAAGNDFRAEFSIRGASFRQIGTVIDGTPTSQLFHTLGGQADAGSISMINTDVLTRATLTAGPHPRAEGDWIGATVSFDIREGSRDRTGARLAVSGTSTSIVSEGPLGRDKRGSWLISLRKSYIGWLIGKIDPSIQGTFGFTDGQAKAVYDLTPSQRVEFTGVGGFANFLRSGSAGADSVRRSSSKSALVSSAWRYAGERLVLQERVSVVTGRITNHGSQLQQQAYNRSAAVFWRSDVMAPLDDHWTVEAGTNVVSEHVRQILRDFSSVNGNLRLDNQLATDARRTLAAAWTGLTYRSAAGHLSAGARATRDGRTDAVLTSPWLTLERSIGRVTLFGGLDRSRQLPALDTLGQSSSPLSAERAWQSEAGVSSRLPAGFRARAAAFVRDDSQVLRRVSEDRVVNGARVRQSVFPDFASTITASTRGVDVTLERRAPRGPAGWFGYTWSHTRDRDTATGEIFDGDVDQRHTINMFVEQRFSYRLKLSAKFRYGSNYPLVGYFEGAIGNLRLSSVRNAVRLPPYARLDLNGSRTFTFQRARLTLFVELVNVTDHANFTPVEGTIRNNLTTSDLVEELIPFVPSAGFLLEF